MRPVRTALFAAAFTLAAPLAAENHVQPAVQPGGDIPAHFRPVAPIPKGGDIPQTFTAPRGEFQYVRREVSIPMRDGVKLYAVLIIKVIPNRLPSAQVHLWTLPVLMPNFSMSQSNLFASDTIRFAIGVSLAA